MGLERQKPRQDVEKREQHSFYQAVDMISSRKYTSELN
jgi:hypothetical protein